MARYKYQGIARDGSGNILSSATVSVFLSGTTTVATVYTTSIIVTSVNSVTTDSAGFFEFYVSSTNYGFSQKFKIIISKSGYTSKTYDEIIIFPQSNLEIDNTLAVDHTYSGITFEGTAGENLIFGNLVYIDTTYKKTSAASTTTMPCVAIAMETIASGDVGTFLVTGFFYDTSLSLTPNGLVYPSEAVAGLITTTCPSTTGNQVQSIGYAATDTKVFFNPSYVLVEVT